MKRVNTTNPLVTTDEDRHKVRRSDVGNKMATIPEQKTNKKQNQTIQ